jgi:hypothetical protein
LESLIHFTVENRVLLADALGFPDLLVHMVIALGVVDGAQAALDAFKVQFGYISISTFVDRYLIG